MDVKNNDKYKNLILVNNNVLIVTTVQIIVLYKQFFNTLFYIAKNYLHDIIVPKIKENNKVSNTVMEYSNNPHSNGNENLFTTYLLILYYKNWAETNLLENMFVEPVNGNVVNEYYLLVLVDTTYVTFLLTYNCDTINVYHL